MTAKHLRILLVGRRELADTQTRQKNQLKALLLSGDDVERALSRGKFTLASLTTIARCRGTGDETVEQAVRRSEARRLAIAIRDAERDLTANQKQLRLTVSKLAPDLLARRGIGPVSAATAIAAWSHPGRCRNSAAFAALAGASPVPASSGRIVRHRLNRGGDRQLN